MMTVHQRLVETQPNFHPGSETNSPRGWALNGPALKRLLQVTQSDFRCLEVGSGWSTCALLVETASLVTIDPRGDKFPLIREWMTEQGYESDLARWQTIELPSYDAWRMINGKVQKPLDLVLIDGLHSFPVVEIDWFYSSLLLKPGGLMVLDDLRIWSVKVLLDVLKKDDNWQVLWHDDKTAILRLLTEFKPNRPHLKQPYVMARSTCRVPRKN